ncbi:MAG: hypothetical protein U0840_21030 [Gemmataceae bacterium]
MEVRILDLDGAIAAQPGVVAAAREIVPLRSWGPRLRLACSWSAFATFERDLARLVAKQTDTSPTLTFVGSGDFHHVSLALLRRLRQPLNLLILDNHPDWMRGVPLLHCGTWVYHAAQLGLVRTIFHVGGDVDFDNAYRWLAPWPLLASGRLRVVSSHRNYTRGRWSRLPHVSLRRTPQEPATADDIRKLVDGWRDELARFPLYVSFDRDVLQARHATVNWDSGHLTPDEVLTVIRRCREISPAWAGMDVVGDWSPVAVAGPLRHLLHWTEHPPLTVDPAQASQVNEQLNLALLRLGGASPS